ncbi:MAG: hypothetical protein NT067_05555 [Candidatus Diapherotrites archaeon]|nr:hypothetical protein [Candidatus Diapherotrites archaeon]
MIKTYEALLATAMLLGTIALISSPYFVPEEKYTGLRDAGENAVLSFCEEESFRNLAVAVHDDNSLASLKAYVDGYFDLPYSLRVCDANSTSNCWGTIPSDKAYSTVSYLFDGNISTHSMKKIQIFVWVFKVE